MATNENDFLLAAAKANGSEVNTITLKLDPLAVPKGLLGFPFESSAEANKVPPNTFYGTLCRPCAADLPGLHSSDATFSNKTIKDAVLKVISGDFTLEWKQIKPKSCDTTEQANIINAVANMKDGSNKLFRGIAGTMFFGKEGLMGGHHFSKIEVLDSQKEAMGRRILHLFLRIHGASIEDYVLDQLQIKLHDEYVGLHWWKEALDLSMICADIAIANRRGSWQVVKSLLMVGECLEATKSYAKASRLYQEIATNFWDFSACSYSRLGNLYNCAALASKRAGDYTTSEALYLKTLHSDLADFNGSWDKMLPLVVNNVLCMYLEWQEKYLYGVTKVPELGFEEFNSKVVWGLLALLLVGQVKTTTIPLESVLEQACCMTNDPFAKGKQLAFRLLSPKYATKKCARKALTEAVANPENVSHFRSTILQCLANVRFDGYETGGTIYGVGSSLPKQKGPTKDLKKEAKTCAREYLKKEGGKTRHEETCRACGVLAPTESFKYCPCKTIKYCSKVCQVADWKHHKKECSYQKAKKKAQASK